MNSIFISYSRADVKYLEQIKTHLQVLVNYDQENIYVWDDSQIVSGSNWEDEIKFQISCCQIALLLVSPNFLASKFIKEKEMPEILRAARERGTSIQILNVQHSPFDVVKILEGIQHLNEPEEPLSGLNENELARTLTEITRRLRNIIGTTVLKTPQISPMEKVRFSIILLAYLNGRKAEESRIGDINKNTQIPRRIVHDLLQNDLLSKGYILKVREGKKTTWKITLEGITELESLRDAVR